MTKLDRYREELAKAKLEARKAIAAGKVAMSHKLSEKIKALEEAIDYYEPHKLSEILDKETMDKHKISELIIKMHLAADYFNDCAMDLRYALQKCGLEDCSLFPLAKEIEQKTAHFAGMVCKPEFGELVDFMVENDQLLHDMHLLNERYIACNLKLR